MEIDISSNWALLNADQRAEWLCRFLLHSQTKPFDHNLIHECIVALQNKRELFVKNMLSELAHTVYAGKSREQIASAATRSEFYYACFMLPIEAVGKCIYWTVRNEEV